MEGGLINTGKEPIYPAGEHVLTAGNEHGPHWSEASALTTVGQRSPDSNTEIS